MFGGSFYCVFYLLGNFVVCPVSPCASLIFGTAHVYSRTAVCILVFTIKPAPCGGAERYYVAVSGFKDADVTVTSKVVFTFDISHDDFFRPGFSSVGTSLGTNGYYVAFAKPNVCARSVPPVGKRYNNVVFSG